MVDKLFHLTQRGLCLFFVITMHPVLWLFYAAHSMAWDEWSGVLLYGLMALVCYTQYPVDGREVRDSLGELHPLVPIGLMLGGFAFMYVDLLGGLCVVLVSQVVSLCIAGRTRAMGGDV